MNIHFLGTGAGLPSKQRNVSSLILDLLQERNSLWMFDCGEATQHQILHTSLKPRKVDKVFITHLHGDHIFGLPGFLSSRSFQGGEDPITVYGPKGIRTFIETTLTVSQSKPTYPVIIQEIEEGPVWGDEQFLITAKKLDHGIDSFGYRITQKDSPGHLIVEKLQQKGIKAGPIYQQFKTETHVTLPTGEVVKAADYIGEAKKGKHIAILGDTRALETTIDFVAGVDLLVHEATFSEEQKALAYSYFHSTTAQAANIAKQAQVKRLLLNHISSRFQAEQQQQLLDEARKHFANTEIANDFSSYEI
ncbi:ribonuclease Z [Gracilibacillus alcaliphilus]|uniref:ribonuclease Z n=1 Tax=Gracilibacillus alcaliphilus TaxID=1401441 RepID=UPI001958816B|nr:ribonuclease Z [Gracilibacillus alcaliphilus]MBM7675101.1 ribonuclease Z [Gracilibacillus alcaliphilus]